MKAFTFRMIRRDWQRGLVGLLFGVSATFGVVLSAFGTLAEERDFPRVPFSDFLGAATLSELRYEHAARGGTVSGSMVERAKDAAFTSPLSTEPFLFAALLEFPSQESLGTAEAEPYLRQVLRRDPRSRGAHLLLVRRYAAERNADAALFHLSRLKHLEPDLVGQLLRNLGAQIMTRDRAEEVAEALSAHLELADGIAEGIANGKAAPEVIARFAHRLPREALGKGSAAPALIGRLTKDGYISQARTLWSELHGLPARDNGGLVYDPSFSQRIARPPFGWSYNESDTGVAEWTGPGSVYIEYYGRRSGTLLSQTLGLLPGRYQALVEVSPQMPETKSLGMQVSCIAGTPVLTQQPISARTTEKVLSVLEFQVPTSCPGQVIAIVGLPNERRVGGSIILHRLSVTRKEG